MASLLKYLEACRSYPQIEISRVSASFYLYSMDMNEYESQLGSTDRFLTVVEAAEILKVNVAHVHELIESGELAAFKVGKTGPWRIEHELLELFIAEQYELSRRSAMWNNSEIASAQNVFEL